MRWTVSDGAKVQWNRVEGKDTISRAIRRRNGIQSATVGRSIAPSGYRQRLECIERIAAREHPVTIGR
jgi:hypothetical protein